MNVLNKKQWLSLYEDMLLIRMCEEHIQNEYFEDEMKTPVHLSIGAEAISAGVCSQLPADPLVFATYRSHATYLSLSKDTDGFFAELYGKTGGPGRGKAGSMHLSHIESGLVASSAVVGTTVPLAVGAAMGQKVQDKNQQVCVFFGDGATEEGVFWESINFACLQNLPILFVCEDNDLAIHSLKDGRQSYDLCKAFAAFGGLTATVDGHDAVQVYQHAANMLQDMQKQGRPGLLHCHYFRFLEHVGPLEDFKFGYRQKPENAQHLDPLVHVLHSQPDDVTTQQLQEIKEKIADQIAKSVAYAKQCEFPVAAELYQHVLSDQNGPIIDAVNPHKDWNN